MFVLDASAALPWCFQDEATPASEALLDLLYAGDIAIVPAHWPVEVLSALIQSRRRRRVEDDQITTFLGDLQLLPIILDDTIPVAGLTSLKALSDKFNLNAFDTAYLALALRRGLPLATNDAALQRACIAQGIPLL